MTTRARTRVGRDVQYYPTPAEVTAFGDGPFAGRITKVHPDGTADLHVDTPTGIDLNGTIDNTFGADEAAILEGLRDLATLRAKAGVRLGGLPGQFAYGYR